MKVFMVGRVVVSLHLVRGTEKKKKKSTSSYSIECIHELWTCFKGRNQASCVGELFIKSRHGKTVNSPPYFAAAFALEIRRFIYPSHMVSFSLQAFLSKIHLQVFFFWLKFHFCSFLHRKDI